MGEADVRLFLRVRAGKGGGGGGGGDRGWDATLPFVGGSILYMVDMVLTSQCVGALVSGE